MTSLIKRPNGAQIEAEIKLAEIEQAQVNDLTALLVGAAERAERGGTAGLAKDQRRALEVAVQKIERDEAKWS